MIYLQLPVLLPFIVIAEAIKKFAVQDREIEKDFSNFQLVNHNPEAIVLGDMGGAFTFKFINNLFNHILLGA